MSWPTVPASELMLKRGGSVNPANYPDETFELLSIPAYDKGEPEVVEGKAIGSSKSCVQPNDVLLSKIVPHIKRCWVVPDPQGTYRQIGSGEWIIFRSDKVHPPFLRHFLTSDIFHRQFMNTTAGVGGSLVRARPAGVGNIDIPLPPLPEQKRIAAILDKADAIRRKRQQAIQLADDFLRAVFLDMFGDPVTNPKGLRKGPITELADIITGNAFKSNEYVTDAEAVRLCRGTNVLTSYFDWSDTAYWSKDQLDGLERYLLSSGDVILAMDRPWISSGLKVCIFPDHEVDTYLVQRVARLRPKEAVFSEYIYSCVKSQAFEKHCSPTETTVPHISPVELRGYEVFIPDKTMLANYHVAVGKIRSAITEMLDAASYAGNAFESLSQKAFSGQL